MRTGLMFSILLLILSACGNPALTPAERAEVIEYLSSLQDLDDTVRTVSGMTTSPSLPGAGGLIPTNSLLLAAARGEAERESDRRSLEEHLTDQLNSGECNRDYKVSQLFHISAKIGGPQCAIRSEFLVESSLTDFQGSMDMKATWTYESNTPWFREKSNVKNLEMRMRIKAESNAVGNVSMEGKTDFQIETVTKGTIKLQCSVEGNVSALTGETDLTVQLEGNAGSIPFEIVGKIRSFSSDDQGQMEITINGQPATEEELIQLSDVLVVMAI